MKRWVVAVAIVLTTAACGGSDGSTGAVSPSPIPSPTPSPSPSPSPSGLTFKLNAVSTSTTASGTIKVIAGTNSVSIELAITGLQADSAHVSHIHVGSCQQRGNIAIALNPVVADGQGNADVRSTINATYPPASGTWYVVVHAGPDMQGSNANYLLCGNLFS